LLAPVALQSDPVLSNVLVAAGYAEDVHDAAAWSRWNPRFTGADAVRAAASLPWHPSVRALLAFPDLLYRMDESPQWTADLGAAFLAQEPQVMDTVQGLRRRAQASGYLQTGEYYAVQQQGQAIAIYPVQPQAIYVPYYDPYVVYGPWWWNAYRPVFWRPWAPRPPVFVSAHVFGNSLDWQRRQPRYVVPRPIVVQQTVVQRTAMQQRTIQQAPVVQAARIAPPAQQPAQVRAEVPRPVAAQQPAQQTQLSRPPGQGGHVQHGNQRHDRGDGRR
jgi:hypothetical protein